MLDLLEETLDEVALAVEREVARDLWGGASWWYHGLRSLFGDGVAECR